MGLAAPSRPGPRLFRRVQRRCILEHEKIAKHFDGASRLAATLASAVRLGAGKGPGAGSEQQRLLEELLQARRDCAESFRHDPAAWEYFRSAWDRIRKASYSGIEHDGDLCLWLDQDRWGHTVPCWLDSDGWSDDPAKLEALAEAYHRIASGFRGTYVVAKR